MKFVVRHPTKNSFLRKPRFVGDSVHWTDPNGRPLSTREPWLFATRSGAQKARDMHALEASVEAWYEAGDAAYAEVSSLEPHRAIGALLSPSNIGRWRDCPPRYPVTPTAQCNTYMQDYSLAVVLAELAIVSSDFGGC